MQYELKKLSIFCKAKTYAVQKNDRKVHTSTFVKKSNYLFTEKFHYLKAFEIILFFISKEVPIDPDWPTCKLFVKDLTEEIFLLLQKI